MIIIKDGTPSFKVTVPPEDMCIGYDGENMVRRIVFSSPAGYDGWTWRVDLILADGEDDVVLLQRDGDVLVWDILDKHLVCPDGAGKVKAQIRANNPSNTLQTKKSNWFTLYAQSSIDAIDKICVSPSEIAQAEKYMDALLLDGQTARVGAEEAAAAAEAAKQEAIRQAELAGDAEAGAVAAEQGAAKERAAAEEAAKQTAADRLVTGQDRAEVERLTGQVRADREQVGKDREAVAGDKAAAETAKTGAEAAEAEVIKQAGIATDQVALATEQAERAKAERERAEAIDAYTKGEQDSRYLRATEIRRPFTDGVIALTDADDAAFGGVTVLGETHETGTGDKGPDNPYALTGVQPTKVTACGRNLADAARVWVWGNPEFSVEKFPGGFYLQADTWVTRILAIPCSLKAGKTYVVSYQAENVGTGSPKISLYLPALNQYLVGEGKPFVPNADTDTLGIYVGLKDVAEGVKIKISDVRVVLGDTAAPYEPYTGQTVSLPAIAPLWGTGDIRDEYDAATGVETRRWKRLVFDGTEAWITRTSGTGVYGYALPDVLDAPAADGVCTHFKFIKNGASGMQTAVCVASASTRKDLSIFTSIATLTDWKAYLAAQAAAGTPVTVVYQLAEPVVTRYGPQRIPTYPAYTYLALNAPAEGAVRYPLSAPMQWDGKADKAAVYDRDTADSRFAGVLTGTASGAVACLEDVSPVGPLRRAATLGATTETGEGDKGPDNPYTFTGVQPASLTVCGRNLLDLPTFKLQKGAPQETTTAVYQDGKITVTGANSWAGTALIFDTVFPPASYCITMNEANRLISDSDEIPLAAYNNVYNGYGRPYFSNTYAATLKFTATKPFTVGFICKAGDSVVYPQIEIGSAASPYQPYTGQTITLPTLAPLYGDGTVCDEYDAATGVETRRWGRVELNGTEAWSKNYPSDNDSWLYLIPGWVGNFSIIGTPMVCTHLPYKPTHPMAEIGISNPTASLFINFLDAIGTNDIPHLKAYLAAQAAAGTPVTVLYQLAEPVVTQHDPARLLPPAPACRVFADAGSVDVGYNRDVNVVIPKLEAALAELLGGGAQPME